VSINSRPVEARPQGVVLVLENRIVPECRPDRHAAGSARRQHRHDVTHRIRLAYRAYGVEPRHRPGEQLLREIRASEDIRSAQVIQL